MPLELHWALDTEFDMFPAAWVEEVVSRRVSILSDDLSGDTLRPDDHLLFLAFHNIFVHRVDGVRLDWIVETGLVIADLNETGGWKGLIDRSVEQHVRIPLELTAASSGLWTDQSPPDEIADCSLWPTPSERETALWKFSATRKGSVYSWIYLKMQGQPGIVEKLRFGCRFVVPPTPMMGKFRRSSSRFDIPIAHIRRWVSIVEYI
jgi:hypothetical protein